MSREAVNQIIERAVNDDAYLQLLSSNPDEAIAGYDLDPMEASALRSGAYGVVVRATRRDREQRATAQAPKPAAVIPTPTRAAAPAPFSTQPAPREKTPVAGVLGFFLGIVVILSLIHI